ncbi:MAG: hypothetical protein NZ898_08110 [Myxococcota bacterium]|nr:hypothetical protein [Myxococcota bacterium]
MTHLVRIPAAGLGPTGMVWRHESEAEAADWSRPETETESKPETRPEPESVTEADPAAASECETPAPARPAPPYAAVVGLGARANVREATRNGWSEVFRPPC